MAACDKFCLVRLVTSDFLELGVRLAPPNSELCDLGHLGHLEHPSISSDFVHQLVASLPPQEVRRNWLNCFFKINKSFFLISKSFFSLHPRSNQVACISVPATATTVVEMLKGEEGVDQEELRFVIISLFIL